MSWILFWIIIAIAIIIFIIKKWGDNIKKIFKTSQSIPSQRQTAWSGWLKTVVIIFIIVLTTVILIWAIISIYTFLENRPKKEKYTYEWVEYPTTVSLSKDYGTVYPLNKGERFDFLGASHPYCVINGRGIETEICGAARENICSQLPQDDYYNNKLQFKLRDTHKGSVSGSVKLVIYRYEKIVH
jgi:preprotein translocase subunit SecG